MMKFILWAIGLIIVVPTALVALSAFQIYVFYPWQHPRNVERMDAKNDLVWEEAIARVVTVEAELGAAEYREMLTTDVVCYEGYFATAWTLKGSGQKTGIGPRSIGFEALQAEFPTGARIDIDMRRLCDEALLMDIVELPVKIKSSILYVVAPERSLYCFYRFDQRWNVTRIYGNAGWVSPPYIVAIKELPLRSLVTLSEMGSSDTPFMSNGFDQRWGPDMVGSDWKGKDGCWG